jgi:hypothetical protein
MSDKEKLEDEAPETVTDKTDDSPDVEGHGHFKGGAGHFKGGEGHFKGGEAVVR